MKVLVDTNVWLDIAANRQPFFDMSSAAIAACINDDVMLFVAGTSLKDLFYLTTRISDVQRAYCAVSDVLAVAEVAAVDRLVCSNALQLECPDYEDGIIAAAAQAEGIDYILTRDEAAFASINIPSLSPAEFLMQQGYEEVPL